jgi:hypothetical protein
MAEATNGCGERGGTGGHAEKRRVGTGAERRGSGGRSRGSSTGKTLREAEELPPAFVDGVGILFERLELLGDVAVVEDARDW